PRISGPHDVVVRVGGAGLCRTDLHIRNGWFAPVVPSELPVTLGHENSGWVHEVGSAVENVAVGDPVICHPQQSCGVCPACRGGGGSRGSAPRPGPAAPAAAPRAPLPRRGRPARPPGGAPPPRRGARGALAPPSGAGCGGGVAGWRASPVPFGNSPISRKLER